jgi:hypothetical protein
VEWLIGDIEVAAGVDRHAGRSDDVADGINNTIRQITPAGVVTTLAGMAGTLGSADGTGTAARFTPAAVTLRMVELPESAT